MTSIQHVIGPHVRDLDGFSVKHVLPSAACQTVGPFIFFDRIDPVNFTPGKGIDVRPHPHIRLATITYLFDGNMVHRDNPDSVQIITPGDVSWMTADNGTVHSERSPPEGHEKGVHTYDI